MCAYIYTKYKHAQLTLIVWWICGKSQPFDLYLSSSPLRKWRFKDRILFFLFGIRWVVVGIVDACNQQRLGELRKAISTPTSLASLPSWTSFYRSYVVHVVVLKLFNIAQFYSELFQQPNPHIWKKWIFYPSNIFNNELDLNIDYQLLQFYY